jgi:hypothetical protein
VEVAGTSEASGVSTGASGAGVAVISDEQGVVEDAGPIVGLGMSVLSVKAGALVGLKDSDAGRSKVAEGLGWSIPMLKPILMPGRPMLIPGIWVGTSVGIDAETSDVYSTGLVGATWEGTSVGMEAETAEVYSTGLVGGTWELISVGIDAENSVVYMIEGRRVAGILVEGGVIVAPDVKNSKVGNVESMGTWAAAEVSGWLP